ncbi:MAG: hypothetical protein LBP51_03965, partial [Deferribacteraceae bacterium]|nr:hypothetical protein [Deferribacteraceae bacterium]
RDGLIYNLGEEGLRRNIPISPNLVGDYHVLISDEYFFYTRIGKLNVKRKKVSAVAENYLSAHFPMDILDGFILFENKGIYTALIYKKVFIEHITRLQEFLNKAKRISTAFCELSKNYNDFIFSSGGRYYSVKDDSLTIIPTADNAAAIDDCLYSLKALKCDLDIPIIKRAKSAIEGYYKPVAALAASFLLFLGGNIFTLAGAKRQERALSEEIAELYLAAGVAGENDPYGALLKATANQNSPTLSPLNILAATALAAGTDVVYETFSINDRSIRIEGKAQNFAAVDAMAKNLEKTLQKQINLEDTRQSGDKVSFTVRYTP